MLSNPLLKLGLITAVVLGVMAVVVFSTKSTAVPVVAPVLTETERSIALYYYNPENDQGPGGAECSENGLIAVDRLIPHTNTPIQDAIKLLLRGEISSDERAGGVTSEFPLAGVSLQAASLNSGVLTLTFSDTQNKTSGGSCRVSILRHQIEATAMQFSEVKSVRIMPEELFQP